MPNPRSPFLKLATAGSYVASRLRLPTDKGAPSDVSGILATLPPNVARVTRTVTVTGGEDWVDIGIDISGGDVVTLVATGRLWMSKALDLSCGPSVALWYRIGKGGRIAKAIDDSTTFVAEVSGRLHLVTKPPGEWLDPTGAFDPAEPRRGFSGAFRVAVVVWRDADGLSEAAVVDPNGPFAREAARHAARASLLPPGWEPLWRIGGTSIFRSETIHGRRCVTCRTQADVGIVRHLVDSPLDESTRLRWSWRLHELPSALAEDLMPTHDYLSIAVEFDDGRDLTYMWSSTLGVGTSFHCPLAWWCKRETHLVVRSGREQLGKWLDEERAVLDDYRSAIGGANPSRVTGVWLIAVSVLQQRSGRCDFASIALVDDRRSIEVL